MSRPAVLGAVLAGGASRRFGRPKAGALVGTEPMVRRVASAVEGAVGRPPVVVSSRPVPGGEGYRTIPDRIEGAGPLGGLHAALHHAVEEGDREVLLLACDLPLVRASLLRAVLRGRGDAPAAAPARPGGVEPLCAVWTVEVLDEVEEALAAGRRSLHRVFEAVGGRILPREALGSDVERMLINVNTEAGRGRAEALLEGAAAGREEDR